MERIKRQEVNRNVGLAEAFVNYQSSLGGVITRPELSIRGIWAGGGFWLEIRITSYWYSRPRKGLLAVETVVALSPHEYALLPGAIVVLIDDHLDQLRDTMTENPTDDDIPF